MTPVSSWGLLSASPHEVICLRDPAQVPAALTGGKAGLAYGMGRSYGDACLNPEGVLWQTSAMDRYLRFDAQTGRLACQSGVLLGNIQRTMIPHGWCLPVTPGTQLVTVGGAIANDVHGKNHHVAGSFGDHVLSLRLLRTDGQQIECTAGEQSDWMAATIGGAGLTGVITEAELQLQRTPGPWLLAETLPYTSLPEFFRLADQSESGWTHTVSWIDCAVPGKVRGLFMRGKPTQQDGRPEPARIQLSIPVKLPFSLWNSWSLRTFNAAYFRLGCHNAGQHIVHYADYFYPLDGIGHVNRLYGRKGFYQHQCVIPRAHGEQAITAILAETARAGAGSFLSVLKTFGDREARGLLSFPRPGVTLALDFPNKGNTTLQLLERLDHIVKEAGGRIYLAKDARMSRDTFESGYPKLQEFLHYRDPGISSGLSRRLMGN